MVNRYNKFVFIPLVARNASIFGEGLGARER